MTLTFASLSAALAAALSAALAAALAALSLPDLILLAAFSSRMYADFSFAISKSLTYLSCQ
jgi:hypothetical protein